MGSKAVRYMTREGTDERMSELIIIPGPPLPIAYEDPGKKLTRASLLHIY